MAKKISQKDDEKTSEVKERMKEIIKSQGFTYTDICKKINVSRNFFYSVSLKSEAGVESVCNFLKEFPYVDANWLLTGSGNRYKDKKLYSDSDLENCEKNTELVEMLKDRIEEKEHKLIELNGELNAYKAILKQKDEVIEAYKDKKMREAIEFMPLSSEKDLD